MISFNSTRAALAAALACVAFSAAAADAGKPAATLKLPENRRDAIPSCYQIARVQPPARSSERAIFVLLDQTTSFDFSLRETIKNSARGSFKPGTEFAFATFSAFLKNRYTDVVLGGRTDVVMTEKERDATGKTLLRNFDLCMKKQIKYAHDLTDATLFNAFGGVSTTIERSDVFASLHDFSNHVVAPSKAPSKTLLIASDMLENSSLSSFYANRAVRKIDAAVELARVQKAGLIPNLKGVRVFVIGAGLLNTTNADTVADSYRNPQTMLALENFWSAYFKAAGAELVEFGKPQLLRQVE